MKRICLLFLVVCCVITSFAQNCASKLSAAQDAEKKKDYKTAAFYYKKIMDDCGENYGNAKAKWKECRNKLNSNKPSDQHVEVKPKPGSPTSPETTLDQYGRVKVSFDAGKVTLSCENIQSIIKQLEDDENLELKIEIPWCRDLYSLQLIEKRIRSIMEIFIKAGIEETRISSDITLVDVLEGFDNFMDICNDNQFSKHVTLINADEGYNACDSAWLKTVEKPKYGIADLSDALSKTKILFDFGKDVPKISDYNTNICTTVNILNINSKLKLVVEGCISSDEDKDLAQRRANRVRDMFIQLGVNTDQIETAAYMVEDPRNRQNTTDLSLKEHRAAIFRIEKREVTPKHSEEDDLADLRELSEALLNIEFHFYYFDSDDDQVVFIVDSEYVYSNKAVAVLNKNKSLRLVVEVYSCEGSTELFRRNLAQFRAIWIRNKFIASGVNPDQIETKFYTENDSQFGQNIHDSTSKVCDVAIVRAEKRETIPYKKSEEDDVADIKDLSDALSNIKILFNYDQDIPTIKDQDGNIYKAAAVLNKNESLKVIIEVSTEGYGEHQKDLAQRRANNVIDLFIKRGVVRSDQLEINMEGDFQNLNKVVVFRIVKR